jgi:hypothetical protein
MPTYSVDVKCFINIEVEAPTKKAARAAAEAWVEWLSPTDEQLEDYLEDHEDAGITSPGGFDIDGVSEVEQLDEDEPEDRDTPEDTPSLDTSFHDHEMDID